MIDTPQQAVNETLTILKDAWEADPATVGIPILWGNVTADQQGAPGGIGNPAGNNPQPFLEVEMLHETASKASLRGRGGSRFEHVGSVMAFLHIEEGKGAIQALPLISVAGDAFQGIQTPGGVWFRNTQYTDIGPQGVWYVVSMTTTFLYDLIR